MTEPIDDESSRGTPPQKQALLALRLVWAALLIGQLFFAGVVWMLRKEAAPASDPQARLLSYVALGFLVIAVPAAFAVRAMIYRAARKGPIVDASGYTTGNIIFLAILEGVSFLGLVAILISGRIIPAIAVPVLAIVIQLFNFPTGRPMHDPYETHGDHT